MMKTFMTLLILFTLFPLNIFAEYEPYTQLSLPEGAKARLNKGNINEIQYSPDGTRLAVAISIGMWLYDAQKWVLLDCSKMRNHVAFCDMRPNPASLQASYRFYPTQSIKNCRIMRQFQSNHYHAVCPPASFKNKSITGSIGGAPPLIKHWHGFCHIY